MNRIIFGQSIPLNEKIQINFTEDDYRLTQLDYLDAVTSVSWDFNLRSFLRSIDIDKVAGLNRWNVSEKGEYTGGWAKRWSKYVKKGTGTNLDPSLVSIIVERIHAGIKAVENSMVIDFTDHADWTPGKFGDSSSCWWGAENNSRLGLIRMGGGAIRFFDVNEGGGRARVWYYPIDGGQNVVLFNVKDYYNKLTLLGISRILSMKFGIKYTRSYNTYVPSSYLDGDTVFIAGANPVDRPITLRFGVAPITLKSLDGFMPFDNEVPAKTNPAPVRDADTKQCVYCYEWFDDYTIANRNGDVVCEECLRKHCDLCHDCEDWFDIHDMSHVGDDRVCERCLDNYSYCETCEEYYDNDETTYIEHEGRTICDECLTNNYTECSDCHEYHRDTTTINNNEVCQACRDNGDYFVCENCDDWEHTDAECTVLHDDNEEVWCKWCVDDNCTECDDCHKFINGNHDCPDAEEEVVDENQR